MSRPDASTLEILNPEALDHDFADLVLIRMSWSRMSSYEWCPHSYFLQYVEKEDQGFSAPMALGSVVHDTLEQVVKEKTDDELDIDGFYMEALMEHDPDKQLMQEEVESGYDWILDTMKQFKGAVGEDYDRVIDVELGFRYIIGAGLHTGYIDLVFWDEDEQGKFIHIVDYKTGNNYNKKGKKCHTKDHGQTKLYTLAAKAKYPGERVKASLYWNQHEEWDTVEYTDAELEEFKIWAKAETCTIMYDDKYKPVPYKDGIKCAYCSFATNNLCRYGAKQARRFASIVKANKKRQGKK